MYNLLKISYNLFKITRYTPEDSNLFQLDLQELATWNNRWHLLLHTSKCRHLHFHFSNTTHSTITYHINGDTLSTNDNIEDLGIIFSTDLHWDVHYSKIVLKAYKIFYLLWCTFTTPSLIARKRLYLMMVRSQLTYCPPLWRPHLIKHIIQFERIQRRATEFILNDYSSDYKSRLFRTHILPLVQFFELNDILFLIRSLKFPTPAFNIYSYITFNISATRSGSNYKLIHNYSSSSLHCHFYFTRIVRLWNTLPSIDLNLPLNTIKRTLYKYFCMGPI